MSRSKVGVLCERIIEAGWLIALITVPLFFNIYSQRVFEPDKLSILRSIALVMLAAWLVKLAEEGISTGEPLSRLVLKTPLVLPTLLLAGVYILSTVTSIAPRISLWGSYQRLQGTYTTLSYIIIFFLTLMHLRRREQLERLVTVVILTSLPISIYGIVQHLGKDPLPWGGDVTRRVASNMGNAIFVAAYLIMAFFLTLERLIRFLGSLLREEEARGTVQAVIGGSYLFILIVQVMCIFFSKSRGPWLGMLGGLYIFVLVFLVALRQQAEPGPITAKEVGKAAAFSLATIPVGALPAYGIMAFLRKGRRWMWLSWVFQTLLGMVFLLMLNLPNTPLQPFRQLPYVGRLGQILEVQKGTGRVRVLIWEGAVKLISPHAPLWSPTGGYDGLNLLRPLIGYGPETMHVAYNPFYPPDLAHYEARNASPDRSHNETFDAFVTTGIIGFAVYIVLFGGIFYYGLRWLGFIHDERHRNLLLALMMAGGILGVLIPLGIDRSLRFAGVGIPVGIILGVVGYTMYAALAAPFRAERGIDARASMLIALLSTIVAHFIEIHLGIAIAATRTYFWIFTAVMVVLGMRWLPLDEEEPTSEKQEEHRTGRKRRRRKRSQPSPGPLPLRGKASPVVYTVALALLIAFIMSTLFFDYTTNQFGKTRPAEILISSLTVKPVKGKPMPSLAMMWLFVFTWLVGGIVTVSQMSLESRDYGIGTLLKGAGIYAAITVPLPLIYGLVHASLLVPGANILNTINYYYALVFAYILMIGLALMWERPLPPRWTVRPVAWVPTALLSLVVVPLLIYATNLSMIQADIVYKQGFSLDNMKRWNQSTILYEKAIQLAPTQDYYYLFLGRAMLEQAKATKDEAQREALLKKTEQVLLRARDLNPYNTDHTANLARLYRTWADLTKDSQKRREFLEKASEYYEQATTLSPNNAQLYNEWALVYMMLGQMDKAEAVLKKSLELDDRYDQTYLILGDFYRNARRWKEAAAAYEKAVELSPKLVQAYSALGFVYAQMGELDKAIEANKKVLEASPNDYISHRNLALLYAQKGRLQDALREAEQALNLAPDKDKPGIQGFINQLRRQLGEG